STRERAASERGLPTLGRITQVSAAPGLLTTRIDAHAAVWSADDADQLSLCARLATGDTGALRDVPRPAPPRRGRHAGYSFRAPTGSVCSAVAVCSAAAADCSAAAAVATSLLMSMRQPVNLAARRAFWPSLPLATARGR